MTRYYLQAIFADGIERLGSDNGAVRHDLKTSAGASRWARGWLERRQRWSPIPVGVRLEANHDSRPYGPPFEVWTIEGNKPAIRSNA